MKGRMQGVTLSEEPEDVDCFTRDDKAFVLVAGVLWRLTDPRPRRICPGCGVAFWSTGRVDAQFCGARCAKATMQRRSYARRKHVTP